MGGGGYAHINSFCLSGAQEKVRNQSGSKPMHSSLPNADTTSWVTTTRRTWRGRHRSPRTWEAEANTRRLSVSDRPPQHIH